LSEYGEKHAVSRLIGSPPGYVGYDEGGQLTEAVKQHPYSLVLFDEMEKAHPDVFHTLLQLLDEGVLTDGQGRKVYFHNTIIIFTTNLAGRFFDEGAAIGFKREEGYSDELIAEKFAGYRSRAEEHLKKFFRPEFINRLDDVVYFHPLSRKDVIEIARIELAKVAENLAETKRSVGFSDKVIDLVVEKGFSPVYGARNIKRTIIKYVEDPLSDMILRNELPDSAVILTINDDQELVLDNTAQVLDPSAFRPEEVASD
jgi:ATP-dependent Clp protease ATP-binding subunit ClpC